MDEFNIYKLKLINLLLNTEKTYFIKFTTKQNCNRNDAMVFLDTTLQTINL